MLADRGARQYQRNALSHLAQRPEAVIILAPWLAVIAGFAATPALAEDFTGKSWFGSEDASSPSLTYGKVKINRVVQSIADPNRCWSNPI